MYPPTMLTIHIAQRPQPQAKRLRYLIAVVMAVLAYVYWLQ